MNREEAIRQLQTESFDLLIIGGGATGTGCALDAASRRLKVALVERSDFASGTSSKSTKLIHGGVRYLEQAVLKFDASQFRLVRDALHERSTLLRIAPHLSRPLPILTPLYNRIDVPYYRTGLKLYDRLAGKSALHKSFFVGAKEAKQKFPMLKSDNLRGGVVYYDGQFDDARMNVALAVTASEHGATVANHVTVESLLKTKGKLSGAVVRDNLSGKSWKIACRVVINAAGPFLDAIRTMDDPHTPPILKASSGTHIVLDKKFSPPGTGLLIPKTEDGRVLFILPWLNHTVIGTTDNPAPISDSPKPTQEDLDYILRQVESYFSVKIVASDILSAWTGLRPLVSNPRAVDTARLSRDHIIQVSDAGLITIAGGKWTTYRKMALDTIDQAIEVGKLKPKSPSQTEKIALAGGEKFSLKVKTQLVKNFELDEDVADHWYHAYGSRALRLAKLLDPQLSKRINPNHPYLFAEVVYAVREESARKTIDVLARRTRLSFLDRKATEQAIEPTAKLVGEVLGRSAAEVDSDIKDAHENL